MNWTLGPQLIRDPSKGEVELLATDMGGMLPLLIRCRVDDTAEWHEFRLNSEGSTDRDYIPWCALMPPSMTREEVIKDCVNKYVNANDNIFKSMGVAIDHYDMLRREGRAEE